MAPVYEGLIGWGSFGTVSALYGAVGDALELPEDACVLEFGCGPGTLTPHLLERVGPRGSVIGVDIADRMIERARGKAQKMGWKNARFERSDIHDYSAPTKVDAVVFSLALSAMPDAPGCLEKARAMLDEPAHGGRTRNLPLRRCVHGRVGAKAPRECGGSSEFPRLTTGETPC
jgi:ubiquinone/menaquinone biosynthesis C-methylase UbiE